MKRGAIVLVALAVGASGSARAQDEVGRSVAPVRAKIVFVNVEQGDGVVMRIGGKIIVSDAGEHEVQHVHEALKSLGAKRIDVAILTHPHDDHVKNFLPLMLQYDWKIELAVMSESLWWAGTKTNRKLIQALKDRGVEMKQVQAGDSFDWGGAQWNVVSPPAGQFIGASSRAAGNASVVYLLRVNGISVLFTGDVEEPVAERFSGALDAALDEPLDIFLATHHGSRKGSIDELLDAVHPRWAVISSGDNGYGHPSKEAIARIKRARASIWCTDVNGSVTARISAAGRLAWRASKQVAPWWSAKAEKQTGSCVGR